MQKKLLIILLFVLTFGLSSTYFLAKNTKEVVAEESNGYRVEEVFSDKFNKKELDSSWTLNDATLDLNYCGIHCISPVSYGYGIVINGATLGDKTRINFTIYPQAGQTESNISFMVGFQSPSTTMAEPNVDFKVQLWNNQLVFCDWQHNMAVNQEKINDHVLREFSGLFSDLLRTDVSIIIERKDSKTTESYVEYSRDGEVVYSSKDKAFTCEDPRNPYGYFGFFWDVLEMDVTNFEVYKDDVLVLDDDLSENSLTYSASDYKQGNFHINNDLNESKVYVSRVSSVVMNNANESIVNKNTLAKLENVSNPYSLGYSVKINSLEEGSFFGFGFGLGENDTKVDTKNAIGFIKKDALTAEIVVLKNGVIDRSNNYQVAIAKLGNGKYIDCTVKLGADNSAYLTVNGLSYKFSNIDFYGRAGVGVVSLEGATKSTSAEMNSFSLERNVYNKYASEDANNDFYGTKVPNEEEPLFTEPYINDQKFFLGTNVLLEEDWQTGSAALTFTNAGPYSGFGYTKEYSEWICEFDIEVLSRQQNQYIGLSFGRKSIVDVLMTASISNSAYLLRCDGSGASTAQVTYGANCKFDDGKTDKTCPVNIFSKDSTKYHFMFVAKNRSVSVYIMEEGAPISDLSILRAKINDVNIDGFVSIVGNNSANFKVFNYKMVNLSDECTSESPITLRESFDSKESVSDKLSLDPISKVVDGKLVMNNSTIATASEKIYEIIRFTTYEVENNLQIMFSGDKKIIFDCVNNKVIIKEGKTSTEFDAGEMNFNYIKGKRFEITIHGNTISIGYKGNYDPQDKLNASVITYELTSPLTEDVITLSANGKVIIDDLYLFSLDNSEDCLTYNYEDDPNNASLWNVKPDFDPSKVYGNTSADESFVSEYLGKAEDLVGCNSSVSLCSLVLGIFSIIPVLVLRKKEEK